MEILFVCTGNTCRSPMAAALMRRELDKRGRSDIMIQSAGLAAGGEPASPQAAAVMEELDLALGEALRAHRSRSVTPEALASADVVAVMTRRHADTLASWGAALGADPAKIRVLGGERGIPDPFGGSREVYRETRDALEEAVRGLADELGL